MTDHCSVVRGGAGSPSWVQPTRRSGMLGGSPLSLKRTPFSVQLLSGSFHRGGIEPLRIDRPCFLSTPRRAAMLLTHDRLWGHNQEKLTACTPALAIVLRQPERSAVNTSLKTTTPHVVIDSSCWAAVGISITNQR